MPGKTTIPSSLLSPGISTQQIPKATLTNGLKQNTKLLGQDTGIYLMSSG